MQVIEEIGSLLALEHRGVTFVVDTTATDPLRPWVRWKLLEETSDQWNDLAANTHTHPEELVDLIDQAIWWYDVQCSEGQPRKCN